MKGDDGGMTDITAPKVIEIVINYDSKRVWINGHVIEKDEHGKDVEKVKCLFRACQIGELVIDDRRPSSEGPLTR